MSVDVKRANGCIVLIRDQPLEITDRVVIVAAHITRMQYQVTAEGCIFTVITKYGYEWNVTSLRINEAAHERDKEVIKAFSLKVESMYTEIMSSTNARATQ